MKLAPDERDLWERVYVAAVQGLLATPSSIDGDQIVLHAVRHADRAVKHLRDRLDTKTADGPYRG